MEKLKGKGAQINTKNGFNKNYIDTTDLDGIDEKLLDDKINTEVFIEHPKKIISYNKSPDLSFEASINPYQGCEHGCVYCYARNSHEYWGFSAGLDFESKIIVKPNAPQLLENELLKMSWKPKVVMLSGNTDCYQPLEKKYELTRKLLEVFLKYRNPAGIITKNALIERDIDVLKEMASENLVRVIFSINTLDENLRSLLEPRTATAIKRLQTMEKIALNEIPVGVMCAPVIPGLNHHEIPNVLKQASEHGAKFAHYACVRLNGQVSKIFYDWLDKVLPEKKDKVWSLIKSIHNGKVNESEFGKRQKGDGKIAETIHQLFQINRKKYFANIDLPPLNLDAFRRSGNYQLF